MEKCACENKTTKRNEEEKKILTTRINKLIGQLNGINNMIQEDRYCGDIIIQLSAVDKAIKSLSNIMLARHLNTCVVRDIKNEDLSSLNEVMEMIKRFQ